MSENKPVVDGEEPKKMAIVFKVNETRLKEALFASLDLFDQIGLQDLIDEWYKSKRKDTQVLVSKAWLKEQISKLEFEICKFSRKHELAVLSHKEIAILNAKIDVYNELLGEGEKG